MNRLLFLIFTFCFLACGGGAEPTEEVDPIDTGKDRKLVLTHLADEIILPAYTNFKVKFELMQSTSEAFVSQPSSTTHSNFRAAWVDAYVEWQKVELFDFGPAEKQTIRNFYNIYPANSKGITDNILDVSSNLETPSSYAMQGFPALDFLLNGVGNSDAEILAYYQNSTEGSKRLAYIKRLVVRMNSLLVKVNDEWNTTYRETFITKTGLDIGSSTSLMINGLVLHYERFIRSGKFGIPSGAMLNGLVSPDKVEALYKKDISKTLASTAHQAYVDFFNGKSIKTGTEGPSLKTYLNALKAMDSASGKSLSDLLNAQFGVVSPKIEVLKPSLYDEVKTNNQAMVAVYTEMQKAVRMLKVDMTSAMSITITYTDNDGD
jgi:predicted lipoprotein